MFDLSSRNDGAVLCGSRWWPCRFSLEPQRSQHRFSSFAASITFRVSDVRVEIPPCQLGWFSREKRRLRSAQAHAREQYRCGPEMPFLYWKSSPHLMQVAAIIVRACRRAFCAQ